MSHQTIKLATLEEIVAGLPEEQREFAAQLAAAGTIAPKAILDLTRPLGPGEFQFFDSAHFRRVVDIEFGEKTRVEAGEIRTTALDPDAPPSPGWKRLQDTRSAADAS